MIFLNYLFLSFFITRKIIRSSLQSKIKDCLFNNCFYARVSPNNMYFSNKTIQNCSLWTWYRYFENRDITICTYQNSKKNISLNSNIFFLFPFFRVYLFFFKAKLFEQWNISRFRFPTYSLESSCYCCHNYFEQRIYLICEWLNALYIYT